MTTVTLTTSTLVDTMVAHAEHTPDSPALTFLKHGDGTRAQTLTWKELDLRARSIAAELQQQGPAGSRAIVACPSGLEYATAFFGCLYAGWIPVPAPAPASARRDYRLGAIAADAGARLALTTSDGFKVAIESSPGLPWLAIDQADNEGLDNWVLWNAPSASPSDPAFLQYTSGSTSEPKGVVVTHAALDAQLASLLEGAGGIAPGETLVCWMPLYHDYGLVGHLLLAAHAGAHLVLMSPASFLRRPAAWLEVVTRYRAVVTGGPNFAFDLCCRRINERERAALDLSSLRTIGCGGEPVRAETIQQFQESFAPCGLRASAVCPAYGMAETVLMVASRAPRTRRPTLERLWVDSAALAEGHVRAAHDVHGAKALVACGLAASGTELRIVNPDTLTRCLDGTIGEIWVSGPTVAAGYWQRPDESLATFGAHMQDGPGTWLRTGDLGVLVHGVLYVTGRRKEVVIVRGHNHYPTDIEHTAQTAHLALEPGAGAAFGVLVNDEERVVLVQEVSRLARRTLDVAAVVAAIKDAVSRTHGLTLYDVVIVEPLTVPKTSSGKVQRLLCRTQWMEQTLRVAGLSHVEERGVPVLYVERAA